MAVLHADSITHLNESRSGDLQFKIRGCRKIRWHICGLVFLYLFIWGGFSGADAQPQSVFAGSVIDSETMNPVSGAVVVLAGTLHGSLTGPDGSFEFPIVYHGEYQLTVSAEGYAIFHEFIHVREDLYTEIFLVPKIEDFPEKHMYSGLNDGLSARLFRGLLPRRINAVKVEHTLYGEALDPGSLYLDGVRLIDPYMPILAMADIKRTQVVPSPYNPGLGMDASVQYQIPERHSTGAHLVYDSRKRGLRSGVILYRDWTLIHGTLSGIYEGARSYTDGSSVLQQAGHRSGTITGRIGVRIKADHILSGSGGWSQDVDQGGEEVHQRSAMMQYKYTRDTGFLQAVHASTSFQGLDGKLDIKQRGGSVSVRLRPLLSLRLKIGADYYRYHKTNDHSTTETGLYVEVLHHISSFLIEGQFRLDPCNHWWGGSSLFTWMLQDDWQLILGTGRVQSVWVNAVVKQTDFGVRWNGFQKLVELMIFAYKSGEKRTRGMTAGIRGSWWGTTFYTAVSDPSSPRTGSQWVIWSLFHAEIAGPFDLFKLRSEVYGTLIDLPAWANADLWIESREISGVSLQMGIHNLFDSTYIYPHSEFAEPGRSFQIALRYQPN